MEYETVRGLYKRYPTEWKCCWDGRELLGSTNSRELPAIQGKTILRIREEAFAIYCPTCGTAHFVHKPPSRVWCGVVERAKDCREFELIRKLGIHFGRKFVAGEKALEASDARYVARASSFLRGEKLERLYELFPETPPEIRTKIRVAILARLL